MALVLVPFASADGTGGVPPTLTEVATAVLASTVGPGVARGEYSMFWGHLVLECPFLCCLAVTWK